MNEHKLKRLFPNASPAFIKANSDKLNLDQDNMVNYHSQMILDSEKLYESYLRTGSVHKVGIEFNTSGETVRQHLMKANKKLNKSKWKEWEIESVKNAYKSESGVDLPLLSKIIGRSYASIACKADELGLCSRRGHHIFTDKHRENISKAQKEISSRPGVIERRSEMVRRSHAKNGHPRGMLGKTHSKQAREAISVAHTGRVRPIEQTIMAMKTRLKNFGTLSPKVNRGSWKASWKTIGGKRKFYRSRWESNYAFYLEFQKQSGLIKEWEHECETFWFEGIKRGCVSYLPDFKVTNNNGSIEFHEIKGWMDPASKTKIRRMAKYYPSVTLKVFDSKWYKSNRIKLSSLIKGWE